MNMAESNSEPDTRADSKSTVSAPVLQPGISEYADLRRDGYAYVDKTRELGHLLDTGKFLFLARPRRFGKTLMLSTIECMYQGHLPMVRGPDGQPVRPMPKVPDEQLFAGQAWEVEFANAPRRPVIRLDMSNVTGRNVTQLEQSLKLHIARHALRWYGRGYDPGVEMRYLRDSTRYPHTPQDMLETLIESLQLELGDPLVLVDEYDTPLLSLARLNPAEIEPYLNLFRDFYRVFKQSEGLLHKVLVTGITRRAYGDQFSALNNLVDCTWRPDLGSVCGFTEEDLDRPPLSTFIETAAEGLAQSTDALRMALREHYNGYRFDRRGLSTAVYNPWSLCRTLSDLRVPELRDEIRELGLPAHWSESGVAKVLVDRLRLHASRVDSSLLRGQAELDVDLFSNKSSSLKSLMLQSGYLTYLPAEDTRPARLGWPNREVASAMLANLAQAHVEESLPGIERIRACLKTGNYDNLPTALLDCLYAFPYNIMEDEDSYHAALHGLFFGMNILPFSERQELAGRFDLATFCGGRVCIIELKYNRSLHEAQEQADRKQYGRSLLAELANTEDATCIALHVSKSQDGEMRIEGAQRPVQDAQAQWAPLYSGPP
ncbi:MAG: AAA family ATPase [Caldilineaceae bacterium]|nr:AAA family ATPase [Caldilineaceae bacterium]